MIDMLAPTSSIPVEAVSPYFDMESTYRPSSRVPRLVAHAYSWGDSREEGTAVAESQYGSSLSESPPTEAFLASVRKIVRLLSFAPGWDSYNARAIDRQRAVAALSMVWLALVNGAPTPAIVPTSDGGIQLEWHRQGVDLEIRVISEVACEVYFEDLFSGETYGGEVGADFTPLKALLRRVAG